MTVNAGRRPAHVGDAVCATNPTGRCADRRIGVRRCLQRVSAAMLLHGGGSGVGVLVFPSEEVPAQRIPSLRRRPCAWATCADRKWSARVEYFDLKPASHLMA